MIRSFIETIIETIAPEFLQAVYMGQINPRHAQELRARMESKRKWSLLLLGACVIIFASTVAFVFLEKYLYFDDGTAVILVIGGLGVSFLAAIFQINNLVIALTYLRALKHSRPGSVSNVHPLYNLDVIDQQLLEKISVREFTDAEARGLLNIANDARADNKRAFILGVVFFVIGIFAGLDPFGIDPDGEFLPIFSMFILVVTGFGFFKRFSALGKNMQYINAIKAKYLFLNGPR